MEYTTLGNTDIRVSKLCVGCMSFGKPGTLHDWTLDEAGTEAIVKHALDLGINFFDTANGYSDGTSEEYLGRAPDPAHLELRFAPQPHRPGRDGQVRPHRRAGYGDRAPGSHPG